MSKSGPRHLLSVAALDDASFSWLLHRAEAMAQALDEGHGPPQSLERLTVASLFYEPSTRTRASFELAALRLGATILNIDIPHSSTTKGESIADTVRTLHAMQVQVFVVRHRDDDVLSLLANELSDSPLALVNAGEGRHAHPTQGLIDALTVQRHFGSCAGIRIAIVGDIAHSRVARSAAAAFTRLGADVRVAGPAVLMPKEPLPGTRTCADFDEALDDAQVVMMLRVQRERIGAGGVPDERSYHAEWGLTRARLRSAAPDAVVMHPGPFNRGVELASDVADGPQSLILRQVTHGLAVRIAVLQWVAAGLERR